MSKGQSPSQSIKALERRVAFLGDRVNGLQGQGGYSFDAKELKALRWALKLLGGRNYAYLVSVNGPRGWADTTVELTEMEAAGIVKLAAVVDTVEIERVDK